MEVLQRIFLMTMGYSAGVFVAGGIFAFIAIIGIVPRLAQRTKTERHLRLYEDMIVLGGIFGCSSMFMTYHLHSHYVIVGVIALAVGVFFGSLSASLAEVLNVMPIFMRRFRLTKGLSIFVLVLALGKTVGSLMYFYLPYFQ